MADILNTGLVVPEIFAQHVVKQTSEKSNLIKSGIVSELTGNFSGEHGTLVKLPYFNDLNGDSQTMKKGQESKAEYIKDGVDVAVVNARIKSFKAADVDKMATGVDPLGALASGVGEYWAREMQKIVLASLKGAFGAKGSFNTVGSGATTAIDSGMIVDAGYALGDNSDKIVGYAMHSATVANLTKQGLIQPLTLPTGAITGFSLLGKQVIVDDGLPFDTGAGEAVSYAFGEGAFGFKDIPVSAPIELDRRASFSETILHTRKAMILHPRGIKWTGNAEEDPSNTNLAKAGNWERVYDAKDVRIVRIHHGLQNVDNAILKLVQALNK